MSAGPERYRSEPKEGDRGSHARKLVQQRTAIPRRPRFLPAACGDGKTLGSRPVSSSSKDWPLLWDTGYAEVINAQKSISNEDQAMCCHINIMKAESCARAEGASGIKPEKCVTSCYWALFDGHGGPVAATLASQYLHFCIKEKLEEIQEGISGPYPPMHLTGLCIYNTDPQFVKEKGICQEHVVIGALEAAFQECDEMIGQELATTNQSDGCTALVAFYLQGKLYIANAGDSRALLIQKQSLLQLSSEFTPEVERKRIQHLAFVYPKLLAHEFTRFEFPRRLKREELGQKVLYRDYYMEGWGYKIIDEADLRYPLIHGQGRRTRLLGTLAVSRGLGDHHLKVFDSDIMVKPFLSCIPEVKVLDFTKFEFLEDDVLIMATDGLWDVMCNEEVAQITRTFLDDNTVNPSRFSELAAHLVHLARGSLNEHQWILDNNSPASYDDISVFAIPLSRQRGHDN
ncbi:protein phosphatase 1M isoform X2 [Ambystoma mexicanum]|uniref:protein phosphatase 1M isoform X2 n=1 Tax=Ambystoma mexicanum TaxID=8296 RepID=UPI0037E77496